jgi:hypothetical protein
MTDDSGDAMPADDDPSLLITYAKACAIAGTDRIDAAIAAGKIKPVPFNTKPGAPSLFPRSLVERLARRESGHHEH